MTEDTLFGGKLRFFQPERGYRFSVDAVLLAHFVCPQTGYNVLDLGAGCGIISLVLAYRRPLIKITALELQAGLYQLLEKNIEVNECPGRLSCVRGDMRKIREIIEAESFDLVVSNPPYRKVVSGRQNLETEEAIARHELKTDLGCTAAAASYAVRNRGRAAFIYPAERLAELMEIMRDNRLEPKRLQMIHGYPDAPARMVILEAVKNGGEGVSVLPPFFVYQEKGGEYTPGMADLYREND